MIAPLAGCPVCGDPLPLPARRFCSKLCYWWKRTGRSYSALAVHREPADNPVAELHRAAALEGLAWQDVEEAALELAAVARDAREHTEAIREVAWTACTSGDPAVARHWRHGFALRYGKMVADGDLTRIPRYDALAQEVASHFPEFRAEDGAARLWALLLSPVRPPAGWLDLHKEALGRVAAAGEQFACYPDTPF